MKDNSWIPISLESEYPGGEFLIVDEYGKVSVGSTSFDFYDAKFWFPMPKFPFKDCIITNDECVKALFLNN